MSVSLEFTDNFSNCGVDDGENLIGLQARASDEDTVYARLSEERSRIFRFDATTVLNRQRLAQMSPQI